MRIFSHRLNNAVTATCALVALTAATAGVTGCSNSESNSEKPSPSVAEAASSGESQSAAAKQDDSERLSIVTSTNVWSNVADEVITSDNVEITPIIDSEDVDPHSFSPAAADIAKAKEADIVVVGGGHYDAWLSNTVTDQDRIIHALPLVGDDHDHEGHDHAHGHHHHGQTNEHVWYDLDKVAEVAKDIEKKAKEKDSSVTTDAAAFTKKLDALKTRLDAIPAKSYAATEPVAEYLLNKTKMKDATPSGYLKAALSESEPAAADVAEFLDLIKSKKIDVLVFNPQVETDVAERFEDAAEDAKIPVVEMSETPDSDDSYLEFMTENVEELEEATQG